MSRYKSLDDRPPRPQWFGWLKAFPVVALAAFGVGFVSNVPDVQWRVMLWSARIRDTFITQDLYLPTPDAAASIPAITPTAPNPQAGVPAPALGPTPTLLPPAPTPVPLPESFQLEGFRYEAQKPNACGPATLAVALSYYGWAGSQVDTLSFLKPKLWDKNVRPDEMLAYTATTGLKAVSLLNGDLELIKRFVSAGFPVIVQKGFWLNDKDGWLGHYELVTAYDDSAQAFVTQDTFQGPDFRVSYQTMLQEWRSFGYNYILVYRPEDEAEVFGRLGDSLDNQLMHERALVRAKIEAAESEGDQKAFALFNQGTSLVALYRYPEAVVAYDEARRAGLPWRMLWYQTGPYKAYFYSGRFNDVIELANATLARTGGLEESLYWRGQAKQAIGDPKGAVADYSEALKQNPNFLAAIEALKYLGYSP